MAIIKFNLTKEPKKGVSKNQSNKNGFTLFLEIYFRKFWKLIQLNILYLIFCIPIVTIGPATAAMMKIARNYSQERNAFLYSDFFDAFKSNFKQGLIMGLISTVVFGILGISLNYYYSLMKESPVFVIFNFIMMFAFVVFALMQFYIYLMMVSAKLSVKNIFKNSLIFALSQLKPNIIMAITSIVTLGLIYLFFPLSILIVPFLPLAFLALVISFNAFPIIRKYVIQPYYDTKGELNPEFEYLNGSNTGSSLFHDNTDD